MTRMIYAVYIDKRYKGTWRERRTHRTIFGAVWDLMRTARRMRHVSMKLQREWVSAA